jgi:hypothetical protein
MLGLKKVEARDDLVTAKKGKTKREAVTAPAVEYEEWHGIGS